METDTRILGTIQSALPKERSPGQALNYQGFWAIADQGVVSLGNFLTTIILARALTPVAYGLWSVIFGLILFLNVLPASLIIYPLTVRLAREDVANASLVKAGLALTALLAAPQILVLFTASVLVAHSGLGAAAGFCLIAWQLQETTRRSLMARLAFGTALCTDAISYLGQAAALWLCARGGQLSPEIAFAVMGLTCGVAGIAQLWFLRDSWHGKPGLRKHAQMFWATGRWVLGSNVLANLNIQAGPWALFLFRGPAEAAGFQAIANLIGVSHPIMLSLGNFLIPAVARVRAKQGVLAARRVAISQSTRAALLLLPLILLVLLIPRPLLGLFYGAASPYAVLDGPLRLLALTYVLTFWALSIRSFLIAVESKNQAQFLIELCGSALFIAALIPLTVRWGVAGAIVATGVSQAAKLASNLILMRQVEVHDSRLIDR
jgi:O-antigen/teichoic acid export membrane protein